MDHDDLVEDRFNKIMKVLIKNSEIDGGGTEGEEGSSRIDGGVIGGAGGGNRVGFAEMGGYDQGREAMYSRFEIDIGDDQKKEKKLSELDDQRIRSSNIFEHFVEDKNPYYPYNRLERISIKMNESRKN